MLIAGTGVGSRGGSSSMCSASPVTGVPRTEPFNWLPGRDGVTDFPADTGGTIEPEVDRTGRQQTGGCHVKVGEGPCGLGERQSGKCSSRYSDQWHARSKHAGHQNMQTGKQLGSANTSNMCKQIQCKTNSPMHIYFMLMKNEEIRNRNMLHRNKTTFHKYKYGESKYFLHEKSKLLKIWMEISVYHIAAVSCKKSICSNYPCSSYTIMFDIVSSYSPWVLYQRINMALRDLHRPSKGLICFWSGGTIAKIAGLKSAFQCWSHLPDPFRGGYPQFFWKRE